MAAQKTPINFEKNLGELENLVKKIEKGDLPLEESIQLFEKGIKLTKTCQQALTSAEQKVQMLVEKNGQQELTPYSTNREQEKQ